jgi:hypothetical protein
MVDNTRDMTNRHTAILKIAWGLSGAICLFTVENIWIDPWAARKSHHKLPSLVPEAGSGAWSLILMALVITVILLVLSQLLLMQDARLAVWKKVLTRILVLAAAILSGEWFIATSGIKVARRAESAPASAPQKHTVVLRWQASTTPNVRYNIYRGRSSGVHPNKLNSTPTDRVTFTDTTVARGQTYCYVVRAVNGIGEESRESNETTVTIP